MSYRLGDDIAPMIRLVWIEDEQLAPKRARHFLRNPAISGAEKHNRSAGGAHAI